MELRIQNTPSLTGTVSIPSSKSHTIRGILCALLAQGQSRLSHCLDSEDTRDALSAAQSLGLTLDQQDDTLRLNSAGFPLVAPTTLYTGNSGITTHFILPLLGLRQTQDPMVIDCGEQMRKRPIEPLVQALTQLGLGVTYLNQQGQLPLQIQGQLLGGQAQVSGITSQYISALLLALPCAPQSSYLEVSDLCERPYLEMTLDYLNTQGLVYQHSQHNNLDCFTIQGGQTYRPFSKTMPGDFSSASYFIAAGVLLPGSIEIQGLDLNDTQGDKALIPLLQSMGALITTTANRIVIQGGAPLQGRTIDANDIPDLLPTLAVIGTYALGHTTIRNVPQARIKETDRIHSMTEGLRRMGARVEEHPDGMTIYQSTLTGSHLNGYGDHRTVMALSLAGLSARGETRISGCEAIHKTFPDFIVKLKQLGANLELDHD